MSTHDTSTAINHRALTECREHIRLRLTLKTPERTGNPNWIEDERAEVALAANDWAQDHGIVRRVTVQDVQRIEVMAVGHVDYAPKLALYIAEFLLSDSGSEGVSR